MKTITITINLYDFDELNDSAKQRARDWLLQDYPFYDWWENTYSDANDIGLKITSFDLDRDRHAKGEFITSAPECAESILRTHGDSCETYKTAKEYLHALNEIGVSCDAEDGSDERNKWESEREKIDNEFLRSILEDYSIMLQKESEYLVSDEHIDEAIRINGYTFTADGKRAG